MTGTTVLVTYHTITEYPQTWQIKTINVCYYLIVSEGQEFRNSSAGKLCLGIS